MLLMLIAFQVHLECSRAVCTNAAKTSVPLSGELLVRIDSLEQIRAHHYAPGINSSSPISSLRRPKPPKIDFQVPCSLLRRTL